MNVLASVRLVHAALLGGVLLALLAGAPATRSAPPTPAAITATNAATLLHDPDPRVNPLADSNPGKFITVGGSTYFTADDGVHDHAIWRTDGTSAGTQLVTDLASFDQGTSTCLPVAIGTVIYFCSQDKVWRSDGTAEGTWLLHTNNPNGAWNITSLAVAGDRLYFTTNSTRSSTNGAWTLWTSDGTRAGTVAVKDLDPISSEPQLHALGNLLLFSDRNQLWRTDGTLSGTTMVDGAPSIILDVVGDALIFQRSNGLWRTDGTDAGTQQISSVLSQYTWAVMGNALWFGVERNGLWKSDGTAAGTTQVSATPAGQISKLTAVGNRVFFVSSAGGAQGNELWTSDGTGVGTQRVKDLRPDWAGDYFYALTAVGNTLYFVTDDRTTGGFVYDLWRSDGTAAGTQRIWISETEIAPRFLHAHGATLLFACTTRAQGNELCASDGTTTGTGLLKDLNRNLGSGTNQFQIVADDRLFFVPAAGGLWTSTGTAASTQPVSSAIPSTEALDTSAFAALNGALLFSGSDAAHGRELWRSNGTVAGTVLLRDLVPGAASAAPTNFVTVKNRVFFLVPETASTPAALWWSDGTSGGTVRIISFAIGAAPQLLGAGAPNASRLYLTVVDSTHGRELWTSDGTAARTKRLADLVPGPDSSLIGELRNVGTTTYFTQGTPSCLCANTLWRTDGTTTTPIRAFTTTSGTRISQLNAIGSAVVFLIDQDGAQQELWRSDGTAAGTTQVKKNVGGQLVAVTGGIVFGFDDGVHGRELWRSDGTTAGTALLRDTLPGIEAGITNMVFWPLIAGQSAVFTVFDRVHGIELWQSDGTADGTALLADIDPGPGSSRPLYGLVRGTNTVYVEARRSDVGLALFGLRPAPLDRRVYIPGLRR